jgi:hypothetical protein
MNYTSVILAAGKNEEFQRLGISISRNRFLARINPDQTLLNLALETFGLSSSTVVAHTEEDLPNLKNIEGLQQVVISTKPKGALATLALTLDKIPENTPLLVTPVDGIFFESDNFVNVMHERKSDVGIVCFESENPNYSYLRIKNDQIIEIAEKKRISNLAASGAVYFRNSSLLKECINWSILNQIIFDNVLYLLPSLNYFIANSYIIEIFEIPESNYFRFSTPAEALESQLRIRNRNHA